MKHKDKRKGILLKMIIDVTEIEIENLNMPKTVKELKLVVENLPSDR